MTPPQAHADPTDPKWVHGHGTCTCPCGTVLYSCKCHPDLEKTGQCRRCAAKKKAAHPKFCICEIHQAENTPKIVATMRAAQEMSEEERKRRAERARRRLKRRGAWTELT